MAPESEPIADWVAGAGPRTVAAGTARVFAAWTTGSPVPEAGDRRCEGVADLGPRRAHVEQVPLFTAGFAAQFIADHKDDEDSDLDELGEPQEMIYDGANAYLRVHGNWTGFFLSDPGGPRGTNDPLWPLDVLFGVRDAVELGTESVRDASAIHYRVTIDVARADAALAAGVSVPAGPYRALTHILGEVWLDEAGLARRIAVTTESATGDDNARTWSVLELWDFGVVADITPPSPDDIVPPYRAYRVDREAGEQ